MATEFGAVSLVPPLLAILLAIVTRRALFALFLGVWAGGIITTGGLGIVRTFEWIVGSFGNDTFHAKIITFTLLLGAGIALIWRTGGAAAVSAHATERLDSRRKVGLVTWGLGILWFFDDYANTAIVGSSMRTITDEMRISREKLAYILDSTAAPVATFGISSWVVYQASMIREGYSAAGISGEVPSAFTTLLWSIPYNVYCLFAVAMVGLVVWTGRDFGEMLDAERRAQRTGKLYRDDATVLQSMKDDLGEVNGERPRLRAFAVPVAALVAVVIGGAAATGYAPGRSALEIANNADFAGALVWGAFAMVAAAIVVGVSHDLLTFDESMETVIDGFGIMLNAVSILVLAWSIGAVAEALGTGEYVTSLATGAVTPALLPIVILFASGVIAFSIGTSWGTMALVTPVAIQMAWEIGGDAEALAVAAGAVFSGAIFGDHCSPISDTTILSSTFAGADHIDHVRTQIYYAVATVLVATLVYLLYGLTELPQWILLPLGFAALVGVLYALSTLDARRKGLSAVAPTRSDADADDGSTSRRSRTDDD